MIGQKIHSTKNVYTIVQRLHKENRPHANIYLCEDETGKKFIIKHFYNGTPKENIGLNKKNHYGRRRDGSHLVFNEIKQKSDDFPFIINHYERVKINGFWAIIIEYIEGDLISTFIRKNYESNFKMVENAVIQLAFTIKKWHQNGFALGDPHLDNAIFRKTGNQFEVILIDYSIIHHADFHYCKVYDCFHSDFDRRKKEDLENYSNKLGNGFLRGLKDLETEFNLKQTLSSLFLKHYNN